MKVIRTTSANPDFIALVKELDAYLKIVDGADHDFYNQYNGIENLDYVVIAYIDNLAVGCGSFKPYQNTKAEIKTLIASTCSICFLTVKNPIIYWTWWNGNDSDD